MNTLPTSNNLPVSLSFFIFLAIALIIEAANVVLINERSSLIGLIILIAFLSFASSGNLSISKSAGEKNE
ncbi:unknown [Eubacterium sp. CAG:603]|nr:unknown [Eubacterium sp. CAG:603]